PQVPAREWHARGLPQRPKRSRCCAGPGQGPNLPTGNGTGQGPGHRTDGTLRKRKVWDQSPYAPGPYAVPATEGNHTLDPYGPHPGTPHHRTRGLVALGHSTEPSSLRWRGP